MQVIFDFIAAHWLFIAVFAGIALAVKFIWKHKERLFYNKPEP